MKKLLFLLVITVLLFSSCNSITNFNYFQDTAAGDVAHIPALTQAVTIKPYDKIYIFITSKDPQLSSIYNLISVQNRIGGQSSNTAALTNSTISSYTVDAEAMWNCPSWANCMWQD